MESLVLIHLVRILVPIFSIRRDEESFSSRYAQRLVITPVLGVHVSLAFTITTILIPKAYNSHYRSQY